MHEQRARASRSERAAASGGRPTAATTWTDVATAPGNNKPLTQVSCPSSSICYAVGDRGNAMKSTDGGATWAWLHDAPTATRSTGSPARRTTVCYATDIYAHVVKTTDGGATWTWQTTPITTPGVAVPGSGGPNPFAGLMAISCSDASTCVASGLYVVVDRPDDPEHRPADRHDDRRRRDLDAADEQRGHRATTCTAISCLPGTTTCTAVGRGGTIVTTTDLATWTAQTSNTTNMLNSVTCLSTSFCIAVGQNGTVDVCNGTTWTATTGNGGTGMLATSTA